MLQIQVQLTGQADLKHGFKQEKPALAQKL